MKSQDIRQSFIDFFREHDHLEIASAPIVAHGDPTLKFVNAGMVQFKDVFLGKKEPEHARAVTAQKCLRVAGKHNDLENVGPSPRHHTFFEMLGNFSFGDYFKEDAIRFGWDLVTGVWGLDPAHLFATVYEEDDDAEALWRKISSLPEERVLRCGAADNFWQMGDVGPCGPCSEIFVDLAPETSEVSFAEGSESGRYIEIWNLVFMQFERDEKGRTKPLPDPSIDTGAGLERLSAVLQGVASNYETDLFIPLLRAAAQLAGRRYGENAGADVSFRVIADHLRAVSFLLADGVIPGPDDHGYVLRRLLRRAVRHGMRLGFEEPFLHRLVPVLGEVMGSHYEELGKTRESTTATVLEEEEKFFVTVARSSRRMQEMMDQAREAKRSRLSGEEIFELYDTHGLDLESVREIAEEERFELDEEGYLTLLRKRQDKGRQETKARQKRLARLQEAMQAPETQFLGYDERRLDDASVLRLARRVKKDAAAAEFLEAGEEGVAAFDRTVFYAESGGQVGDQGVVTWGEASEKPGRARVKDTQKDSAGTLFHFLEVEEGRLRAGDRVGLAVDEERRLATERHHTATHLLHAALHQVLGEGARQAGSLVAPDRLRFDFNFHRPLGTEELEKIEDLVNRWVLKSVGTEIVWRDREEALEAGAMALFGEKYGDRVRTVEIPGMSLELCGGCHVRNTGEIGPLVVTGERGVASGVRRIEAIAGQAALHELKRRQGLLAEVGRSLGVEAERAPAEAEALKGRLKELERELAKLRRELVAGKSSAGSEEIEVAGIQVVAREVPNAPSHELRNLADTLRDKLGSGVVVLGSRAGGKVSLIVTVSKDLTPRLHAGRLVKTLATTVGGSGGGRPDFAQAGGKEPERLPQLLEKVPEAVEEQLS